MQRCLTAATYTQAIKLDPSNATLYSNRAAAFLNLVKLNKALADAKTAITLNPQWEKGYFRKGCVLEAMEKFDDALAAFKKALQLNPQSSEKVETLRSNVDMSKHLGTFKSELSDKKRRQTDKYAPAVNIDKAFESPQTHSECFFISQAICGRFICQGIMLSSFQKCHLVWKGQGTRKWKHGQHDGFFVQFESPNIRKLWFIPSSSEKGQLLCRDPELLDITAHELLPKIFK
ncbi:unnamed protein product [Rhodiola kirilowii]